MYDECIPPSLHDSIILDTKSKGWILVFIINTLEIYGMDTREMMLGFEGNSIQNVAGLQTHFSKVTFDGSNFWSSISMPWKSNHHFLVSLVSEPPLF